MGSKKVDVTEFSISGTTQHTGLVVFDGEVVDADVQPGYWRRSRGSREGGWRCGGESRMLRLRQYASMKGYARSIHEKADACHYVCCSQIGRMLGSYGPGAFPQRVY